MFLAAHSIDCKTRDGSTAENTTKGDAIEADTPGSNGTRLFKLGGPFTIAVTTRTSADDSVVWALRDDRDVLRASGRFTVASGARTTALQCSSSAAGYFSYSATLERAGNTLPSRGTRPAGIVTFGVLPDVSAVLPPVRYARDDQHRFGGQGANFLLPGEKCCDGDGYRPLYTDLGLAWTNDNRNWYMMEPERANTFSPSTQTLTPHFRTGDILRLIQLDGIPGWASPTGKATHSYLPVSIDAYGNYMRRVGTDSALIRNKYFPRQTNNYYQVTWEPDPDSGLPWRDTDAHFVALYRATYEAIHATDPHAVVMGTTNASVRVNTRWLDRLSPLGLARYLDGVAIHGYYDVGCSPSHPPERLATDPDPAKAANALPASMRELRRAMARDLKPGAKLFVTETGISYDIDSSYGFDYPTHDVLFAQGAVVARAHLILLGEGADVTYVFYSSDPPDPPPGYGLFFDLANAKGGYGASNISPKPAAMVVAAMTRIIDGTTTLGYLSDLPAGVYGYAFQRLNGGKVVTALWTHSNAAWNASTGFSDSYSVPYSLQVDTSGTSGKIAVLDAMGNAATLPYSNGRAELTLSESPIYVVSANAAVMKSHVSAPAGYIAR
ncbi:MAG TPA: hypothetical protein VL598_14265 [Trinickia sp.]|uniref:hypothetical protein n=1 Tax=Trinickia sp. TaxID=2571163 RepID=UPI002CF54E5A|nr:hypothetical protein [Trinickia sp.]HTI18820.1 hypothetical protein [Trinickia sp.]